MRQRMRLIAGLFMLLACGSACAEGGPFRLDYKWTLDQHGIWSRGAQLDLEYAVLATEGAGALWLGNDQPLGHTFWQTIDSTVIATAGAEALKYAFSRARPYQGGNPNLWFQGHGHQSFPSGEVTLQASFVTPFIIDYGHEHPWIWLLEALPVYDGIARMKSQAHWQSDVIAGWLLGSGVGYWAAKMPVPLSVRILPGGLTVGFYRRF